jgi:hypothetical protein
MRTREPRTQVQSQKRGHRSHRFHGLKEFAAVCPRVATSRSSPGQMRSKGNPSRGKFPHIPGYSRLFPDNPAYGGSFLFLAKGGRMVREQNPKTPRQSKPLRLGFATAAFRGETPVPVDWGRVKSLMIFLWRRSGVGDRMGGPHLGQRVNPLLQPEPELEP